jgi:hypothetical protein
VAKAYLTKYYQINVNDLYVDEYLYYLHSMENVNNLLKGQPIDTAAFEEEPEWLKNVMKEHNETVKASAEEQKFKQLKEWATQMGGKLKESAHLRNVNKE